MIKNFTVKKLFGQFNYVIDFRETGINILTGPNGYGKSTILKIIESLVEKDLYELNEYSFEEIRVTLTSNSTLIIKKNKDSFVINNVPLKIPLPRVINRYEKRIGIPFIERISPDEFIDVRSGNILSISEVRTMRSQYDKERESEDKLIAINIDMAKEAKSNTLKFKDLDKFIKNFRNEIGSIKFIKEQRLIRKEIDDDERYYSRKKEVAIEVISEIPGKIQNEIKQVVLKYSEVSSQLDSSFPKRLFAAKEGISQSDYLNAIGDLIIKQEKIIDYNLLKDTKSVSTEYIENYSQALKVYLQDTQQKVEVFDSLVKKLDLFKEIVNKKLNFKQVKVSSDKGLVVERDDGQELELTRLSSGEQQIIVLYYELIFGIQDKYTLLIDEPEISLHIAWQMELLNDFKKIVALKDDKLHIIIATHAPQVIGNHWDLVTDLGEKHAEFH